MRSWFSVQWELRDGAVHITATKNGRVVYQAQALAEVPPPCPT
jgi:hypothetical protein